MRYEKADVLRASPTASARLTDAAKVLRVRSTHDKGEVLDESHAIYAELVCRLGDVLIVDERPLAFDVL